MKIIHCSNSKELLFSLIEFFRDENSILIVTAESSRISPEIIFKLKKLKLTYKCRVYIHYVELNQNTSVFYKILRRLKYYRFLTKIGFKFFLRTKHFYYFTNTPIFEILKFCSELTLMEHGTGTYLDRRDYWKGDRLLKNQFCGGLSKRVSRVYLQRPEKAINAIKKKVKKYDLKLRFDTLSNEKKEIINSIYSFENKHICENVIITGHYSESGYFSEVEKVLIYKRIIKEFNLNQYCIKPHPRENTNYSDYFNCFVIDKFVPFELFLINGIKFKSIITIDSSSGLIEMPDTKIYVLGSKYDDRIYNFEQSNF